MYGQPCRSIMCHAHATPLRKVTELNLRLQERITYLAGEGEVLALHKEKRLYRQKLNDRALSLQLWLHTAGQRKEEKREEKSKRFQNVVLLHNLHQRCETGEVLPSEEQQGQRQTGLLRGEPRKGSTKTAETAEKKRERKDSGIQERNQARMGIMEECEVRC